MFITANRFLELRHLGLQLRLQIFLKHPGGHKVKEALTEQPTQLTRFDAFAAISALDVGEWRMVEKRDNLSVRETSFQVEEPPAPIAEWLFALTSAMNGWFGRKSILFPPADSGRILDVQRIRAASFSRKATCGMPTSSAPFQEPILPNSNSLRRPLCELPA